MAARVLQYSTPCQSSRVYTQPCLSLILISPLQIVTLHTAWERRGGEELSYWSKDKEGHTG